MDREGVDRAVRANGSVLAGVTGRPRRAPLRLVPLHEVVVEAGQAGVGGAVQKLEHDAGQARLGGFQPAVQHVPQRQRAQRLRGRPPRAQDILHPVHEHVHQRLARAVEDGEGRRRRVGELRRGRRTSDVGALALAAPAPALAVRDFERGPEPAREPPTFKTGGVCVPHGREVARAVRRRRHRRRAPAVRPRERRRQKRGGQKRGARQERRQVRRGRQATRGRVVRVRDALDQRVRDPAREPVRGAERGGGRERTRGRVACLERLAPNGGESRERARRVRRAIRGVPRADVEHQELRELGGVRREQRAKEDGQYRVRDRPPVPAVDAHVHVRERSLHHRVQRVGGFVNRRARDAVPGEPGRRRGTRAVPRPGEVPAARARVALPHRRLPGHLDLDGLLDVVQLEDAGAAAGVAVAEVFVAVAVHVVLHVLVAGVVPVPARGVADVLPRDLHVHLQQVRHHAAQKRVPQRRAGPGLGQPERRAQVLRLHVFVRGRVRQARQQDGPEHRGGERHQREDGLHRAHHACCDRLGWPRRRRRGRDPDVLGGRGVSSASLRRGARAPTPVALEEREVVPRGGYEAGDEHLQARLQQAARVRGDQVHAELHDERGDVVRAPPQRHREHSSKQILVRVLVQAADALHEHREHQQLVLRHARILQPIQRLQQLVVLRALAAAHAVQRVLDERAHQRLGLVRIEILVVVVLLLRPPRRAGRGGGLHPAADALPRHRGEIHRARRTAATPRSAAE